MKKVFLCSVAALALAACGGSTTDSATVDEALVQLSLKESGSGRVDFEDQSISGADATFKNVLIHTSDFDTSDDVEDEFDSAGVELDTEGSDILISEMVLAGLSMDDAGIANFKRMTLNSLKAVPGEGEEPSDVDVTAEMVELVEPTAELAAWLAGVFGTAEPSDIPEPENIQFKSFKMKNFLAEGLDDEGEEARFAIASVSADEVTDLKIGDMAIEGMDLMFTDPDSGSQGVFTLGKIGLKGMSTDLIKAMSEDDEEAANDLLQTMYGNPVDPGFDGFVLTDMLFDMDGLNVSLPSMTYDVSRNKDGVPTRFNMPKFTLKVDADDAGGDIGAQVATALLSVGFESLEITGEGVSTYDPETDIATGEKSRFAIKDALTLEMTSKVGGLTKLGEVMQEMDSEAFASGEQDPQAMVMDMYSELDFYQLSFTITDDGVVDKALMFFAAQQGADPEQLRQLAVGTVQSLPAMASGFGVDPALATELSGAIASFLTDGGALTLSFDPEEPFTIDTFMGDPTLATKARLGFTATTE
ncbi:MAG: hypothetical protein CMK07_15975 [Ponticaulis sp.]|nr:hypothetical protein [Ponticaulis sp.]